MEAHIIHALKEIKDYFSTIPSSTWYTLLLVVGSSAVISGVLQAIKHWGLVTQKKAVIAALSGLSVVGSYLATFIQYGTNSPKFLGDLTPAIIAVATVIYHFLTSPLYKKIIGYLSKAEALSKEIQTPTIATEPTDVPTADTLI